MDDDYGDLRLQAGSPCIDVGDPAFVAQPGETDLEGHARVLCGRVDMGAHEFGIGDYDCNQTVYLTDFAAWPGCMTDPLGPAAFHSTFDNRHSVVLPSTSTPIPTSTSPTSPPSSVCSPPTGRGAAKDGLECKGLIIE